MVSIVSAAALALAVAQNTTTFTTLLTSVETITSCAETVTDCPARNHNGTAYVTHIITSLTTYCPESESSTASTPAASSPAASPSKESTSSNAATTSAPTAAPTPAASNSTDNGLTTYVTVEQGVTVTVVGTKSTGVAEVASSTGVATANGANFIGGAAAALAAGALLL